MFHVKHFEKHCFTMIFLNVINLKAEDIYSEMD